MEPAVCRVIGLEKLLYEADEADTGCEFLVKEQACVGRKIPAVEINFELLIAFERNGV